MAQIRPVLGRIGGKVKIAPWICSILKDLPWRVYCEPFAGSAAVYFRLVSDGEFEKRAYQSGKKQNVVAVLNDSDYRIIETMRVVRDFPWELAMAIEQTPYSREEHRRSRQNNEDDIDIRDLNDVQFYVEKARRYLTNVWQAFTKNPDQGWGYSREQDMPATWRGMPERILAASHYLQGEQKIDSANSLNEAGQAFVRFAPSTRVELARQYLVNVRQGFSFQPDKGWGYGRERDMPASWKNIPDLIREATSCLRSCYLECDDFCSVMRRWDTPETLHYIDPPYYQKEYVYKGSPFTRKDHERLAEMAHSVEGQVAISYYPHKDILSMYPQSHWERYYKETVASSTGITRTSKIKNRSDESVKRTEVLLVRKSSNKAYEPPQRKPRQLVLPLIM